MSPLRGLEMIHARVLSHLAVSGPAELRNQLGINCTMSQNAKVSFAIPICYNSLMRSKRRWIGNLLAALITGLVIFACVEMSAIPPEALTYTAKTETMVRIRMYLRHEKSLPKSLDILPVRQGYANRTTDAWGQPLIYSIKEDGFTLSSLGRDGATGGSGEDKDLVKKFRIVDGVPEEILP